ncbi:MAG: Ig-like domain-containing protein [Candidatus Peribacteraceae bacterium]|nr:Ig-like domain-containing protein [Candidatus Peribacteraceae bacterium]
MHNNFFPTFGGRRQLERIKKRRPLGIEALEERKLLAAGDLGIDASDCSADVAPPSESQVPFIAQGTTAVSEKVTDELASTLGSARRNPEGSAEGEAQAFSPTQRQIIRKFENIGVTYLRFPDANGDGDINAQDVLLVINRINAQGTGTAPDEPVPPFLDTNGDGDITAADPLLTINTINNLQGGPDSSPEQKDPLPDIRVHEQPVMGNVLNGFNIGSGATAVLLRNPPPESGEIIAFGADGSFTFLPRRGYVGTINFQVAVRDTNGLVAVGNVKLKLEQNLAPTAVDGVFSGYAGQPISGKVDVGDPDGDGVSVHPQSLPTNGTLSLGANGTFTYQPNQNYHGTDQFTFTASDGIDHSDIATATLISRGVNQSPVFVNPQPLLTMEAGKTFSLDLNGLVADPDGTVVYITGASSETATVVLGPDGIAEITANPDETSVTLHVTAKDVDNAETSAVFTIVVTPDQNLPPVFVNPQPLLTMEAGKTLRLDLNGLVADPDGTVVYITGASSETATVVLGPDGIAEITANPDETSVTLHVTAKDVDNAETSAVFTIVVTPDANVAPEIEPREFHRTVNTLFTLTPADVGVTVVNPEAQLTFRIAEVRDMDAWVTADGTLQGVSYTDGRIGTVKVFVSDATTGAFSNEVTCTFVFDAPPAGEGEAVAMERFASDVDAILADVEAL